MTTPAIEIHNLSKHFGQFTALDDVNFTVNPGEVMGFLGPNGAGKSTTIRILLGLLKASSGHAHIFGHDVWSDPAAVHQQLAYVPGDVALWPSLTGGQCIDVLTKPYQQKNPDRVAELMTRFDLDPRKKSRTYSKGNRQKVALIAALSLDVDLLILDEPTSGLDPLMEAVFQQCVQERVDNGAAVLLSSHILTEVQALADSITIIKHGQIVSSGSFAELQQQSRTRVNASTAEAIDTGGLDLHDTAVGDSGGHTLECTVDQQHLAELIGRLHTAGLQHLTVEPPSLDELFLDFYDTQQPNNTSQNNNTLAADDDEWTEVTA